MIAQQLFVSVVYVGIQMIADKSYYYKFDNLFL